MIITRTPCRITLAGGGTDIPSYYQHSGGLVATMAINKYIYITLKPDSFEQRCKLRYSEIEITNSPQELRNTRAREALTIHDINNVEINTCADLPSKSGLGSSGSFLVGLLKVIREYKRLDSSPQIIAEEACNIEIERLNEPVGKQDQYIAAYGGIRILEINTQGVVQVNPLVIDHIDLIPNMHVYSLGLQRDASEILKQQQNGTQEILNTIRDLGYKSIKMLQQAEFDQYGLLLDTYWTEKKKLSGKVSTKKVNEIYEEVKSRFNVLGGKIIGAGGGGFLLLYINKKHNVLENFMASIGLRRLHYQIDTTGSRTLGNFL